MQRHRAITSTGAVVDQPSVGELADLVAEVDRSGPGAFLVIERRAGASGRAGGYLQARRDRGSWVLELGDGGPAHQYRSEVTDPAIVYAAVTSWVLRARAWQGLAWQRLHALQAVSEGAAAGLAEAV